MKKKLKYGDDEKSSIVAGNRSGMPLTERGRRRYDKIVATATEQFLKKGYEAVSFNEIIRASGGSLSTAYKCFQCKEGLFWTVFESVVQEVKERYLSLRIGGRNGRESLKMFVANVYENMFDPKISRLLLVALQMKPLRERTVQVLYRELFELLLGILDQIGKRYRLQFTFGPSETLLFVLRHARGTVLEFMFVPKKLEENKRVGIEQTTNLLFRLTTFPAIETKKIDRIKHKRTKTEKVEK